MKGMVWDDAAMKCSVIMVEREYFFIQLVGEHSLDMVLKE
jgi:hypothetical protein